MIRIRNPDGSLIDVPDACFVELTDEEGRVAEVTFQSTTGEIKRLSYDDKNHSDYEKLFNVQFISRIVVT